MPITETQRQLRKRHIGSSDSAAILGLSPWQTASDVYASKVYDCDETETTEAMTLGNYAEPMLIRFAADELGVEVIRNQRRVHADGICAANLDAMVKREQQSIEAKFSSAIDEWGEAGTDEVPDNVQVQCQHQCYVAGLEVVWVPVLLVGFRAELRLYKVPRNERLIKHIVETDHDFWNSHVLPQVPPEGFSPSLSALRAIRREPESRVTLDEEGMQAVTDWQEANRLKLDAKKEEERKKARLISLLGDAESADAGEHGLVTFLEQTRKAYEVAESTYRVLRLKKRKDQA